MNEKLQAIIGIEVDLLELDELMVENGANSEFVNLSENKCEGYAEALKDNCIYYQHKDEQRYKVTFDTITRAEDEVISASIVKIVDVEFCK